MPESVTAARRMTVDEFLAWVEEQPGRYELEQGEVVAMSPERTRHARAKAAAHQALSGAIAKHGLACEALPDGMTIRIDAGTAYEPDALVYCGPRLAGDAVEVPAPIIVVEVLSPSTAHRDIAGKLAGYFKLPSLAHYLIVDPDRRILVHHARSEGRLIATRILTDGALSLDPPGIEVEVADLLPTE